MAENPADRVALRRLEPEDVPVVAQFEREIAEISFPDDPVTDPAFYERKLRQAVTDAKSEPMVGEAGGRIVAWAWIGTRENFITHERYGELRSFYVVADFRGTGYASTTAKGGEAGTPREPSTELLDCMGHDPVDVDALCSRAGLSVEQVSAELLRLELDGRVAALPGGLYQRLEKGDRG